MRFSASMLSKYMNCPLQAKFHYFDKLPGKQGAMASFGVCVHKALEFYNLYGDIEQAVAIFKDGWHNPEKYNVVPEVWPRQVSFGSLLQRGEDMLRNYAEKNRWEKRKILATEYEFLVPCGDHTLYGFIDLLELKKSGRGYDTIKITDYKTSTRTPSFNELQNNVQFTIYHYASLQSEFWTNMPGGGDFLFDVYKDTPRRPFWYALYSGKEVDAGDRTEKDFQRMYRVMDEIAKAIDADIFVPNISGSTCTFCDFKEQCGLRIKTRQEVIDEEDSWF
jgi:hypothetical protein